MIKVLIVIGAEFDIGGVQVVMMDIIRNLRDSCLFDVLLFTSKIGSYEKEFLSYGGQIHRIPFYEGDNRTRARADYYIRGTYLYRNTMKLLKREKYDVIHCNNALESGIVLKAAAAAGIQSRISHAHGMYLLIGNIIRRKLKIHRRKLIEKYANIKIACSNVAGKSMFPNQEFINIYNPVDISYYASVVHKEHECINLIQIGSYGKNKNQIFSLHVLKKLIESGANASISFIGFVAEKEYYHELVEYVRKNKLEDHVSFLEKDTDKRICFAQSDFLLLPSYTEGLSIASLEAQSAGIKCIISDSVPEDCDCGLCYFLNNEDVDAWADYILNNRYSQMKIDSDKANKIDVINYCKVIQDIYYNKR